MGAAPLVRHALSQCLRGLQFADVLFFGCQPLHMGERFIRIANLDSVDAYSEFVFKCLWPFVETDHLLVVQWDGFVANPSVWRDEFLDYDYIGAPWAWAPDRFNVGNGGFSLRSRKLLEACRAPSIRRHPEVVFGGAEDIVIGRIYRQQFEQLGLRYAPLEMAQAFSYETGAPTQPPFGFHGPANMPLFTAEADLVSLAVPLAQRLAPGPTRQRFIENCRLKGYQELVQIFS